MPALCCSQYSLHKEAENITHLSLSFVWSNMKLQRCTINQWHQTKPHYDLALDCLSHFSQTKKYEITNGAALTRNKKVWPSNSTETCTSSNKCLSEGRNMKMPFKYQFQVQYPNYKTRSKSLFFKKRKDVWKQRYNEVLLCCRDVLAYKPCSADERMFVWYGPQKISHHHHSKVITVMQKWPFPLTESHLHFQSSNCNFFFFFFTLSCSPNGH